MARRRRKPQGDSLDLLLDTMCNAFGGIVLIAILVAMLIQKPGEKGGSEGGRDEDYLRETREKYTEWKEIEVEVARAESEQEKMGDLVDLILERDRLSALLEEKQRMGTMTMIELIEKLQKLLQEKEQAERNEAGLKKEIASMEEMLKDLLRQLKELEDQEKELIAANKHELRPPRLGDAQGQQLNFIVRYDEVFPTQMITVDAAGNLTALEDNTEMISWSEGTATPIAGRGWKIGADNERIKALFESVKRYNAANGDPEKQAYAISIVFSDSFDTIGDLRRLIQQVGGVKDGWEPVEDSFPLSFGSGGARLRADQL